jgi:hypothetical protein
VESTTGEDPVKRYHGRDDLVSMTAIVTGAVVSILVTLGSLLMIDDDWSEVLLRALGLG